METVHVVAINPYRKGNKGKVFSYPQIRNL